MTHWTTEQDPTQDAPLSAWCPDLQSRTPARGGTLCAWHAEQQRTSQAREPFNCLNGQSYREILAKEAFWLPATRGSKKDSDRAITPAWRQSVSLHTWHHQSPCKPSNCTTFMLNSHWGRAATGKNVLHLCTQGRFGSVQLFAAL